MRVLIYEFLTGGGGGSLGEEDTPASLLVEGRAMADAVTADFAAVPGVQVITTRDSRLPPFHDPRCSVHLVDRPAAERTLLAELAAIADWTLLIAPENAGILLERSLLVQEAGGRLLSPSPPIIRLASDKHATAEHLAARGIRVPEGQMVDRAHLPVNFPLPAVLKPLDGCGSAQVSRIENRQDLSGRVTGPMRLEAFVPGISGSVAILCGPKGQLALPACQQLLSDDGRFRYLGGRLPISAPQDDRARRLALLAIESLAGLDSPDGLRGYLGVDLVLGGNPDGSGDRVIEINPRLTTSYVGLRAACRGNLAAAMLAIASGNTAALSCSMKEVQFSAAGHIISTNHPA
jgi:predicted ATP-grasp superfamily ATP-dependent carboligase